MNKKAIIPIISMSLLIIVVVVAIISLQNWFSNFNSNIKMKVENQNTVNNIEIENLIGTILYLKNLNSIDIIINSIKIGDKTCNIDSQNISPGLQEINISDCVDGNLGTINEVVVISDQNVYSKSIYLEEEISDTAQEVNINSIIDDFSLGNLDNIQVYNDNLVLDENSGEYFQTGNYTSKVYDAGALANWDNLSIEYSLSNKFISSESKNNLVAYYSFNGNADDELENFDGSVVSANLMAGVVNQCYNFDGENEYITYPTLNKTCSDKNWSVSIWFNPLSSSSDKMIWHPRGECDEAIWITPTGRLRFVTYDGNINYLESSFLTYSVWHQVVVTHIANTTEYNVYIDGSLQMSGSLPNPDLKTDTNVIGRQPTSDLNRPFKGGIDELGIWNRVLTSEEVTELYNNGDGLNYLEPTNLTLQIRTSNDNVIWSEWSDKSLLSTNIVNSVRYFQFRVLFKTTDITSTPILNKISFDYELN